MYRVQVFQDVSCICFYWWIIYWKRLSCELMHFSIFCIQVPDDDIPKSMGRGAVAKALAGTVPGFQHFDDLNRGLREVKQAFWIFYIIVNLGDRYFYSLIQKFPHSGVHFLSIFNFSNYNTWFPKIQLFIRSNFAFLYVFLFMKCKFCSFCFLWIDDIRLITLFRVDDFNLESI